MRTAIFQNVTLAEVKRHAKMLSAPRFHAAGRLVAVQSPMLDQMSHAELEQVAQTLNLPLVKIVDKPPFPHEAPALALGPGGTG